MTPTNHTPGLLDARGVAVVPGPYFRVASLVPSLTDTVFGLGRGDSLVARTAYCEEPHGLVARVPACGGTKNPRLDDILAQRPDLVLACLEENKTAHLEALAAAGVPVFAVMPRSLDDVDVLLKDLGILLDAGDAAQAARAALAAARTDVAAARGGRPPVAAATLIWKDPWMAAGGSTHIDAVMAEVGLRNVYGGHEDYPSTTLDELAALGPALVLLPDEPYHFTKRDAVAVSEALLLAGSERCPRVPGKLLSWYGTRTAGSLRELQRLLGRVAPAAPASTAG